MRQKWLHLKLGVALNRRLTLAPQFRNDLIPLQVQYVCGWLAEDNTGNQAFSLLRCQGWDFSALPNLQWEVLSAHVFFFCCSTAESYGSIHPDRLKGWFQGVPVWEQDVSTIPNPILCSSLCMGPPLAPAFRRKSSMNWQKLKTFLSLQLLEQMGQVQVEGPRTDS